MEDYIWILAIVGIAIIWGIIAWIIETISNSKKYIELKPKLDNLEKLTQKHESKVEKDGKEWRLKVENWNAKVKKDKVAIKKIAKQKSMGFPWLAKAYADYFALKEQSVANYLKNKAHPAYRSAEIVDAYSYDNQKLRNENETIKYKIDYLESLFPWLKEFIANNEKEEILSSIDNPELVQIIKNSKRYKNIQAELNNLEHSKKEYEMKAKRDEGNLDLRIKRAESKIAKEEEDHESRMHGEKIIWDKKVKQSIKSISKIAEQKSMGFPWLAEAYADYFTFGDGVVEGYLRRKKHPALAAAENVRIIKEEKRQLAKEKKITDYKINYFEKLFPWLTDLIAEDENDEIPVRIDDDDSENNNNEDRTRDYLTPEEYKKLPSVERNQMALNRYLESRNKSNWAIGRDYEMYVGYLYQQKGYSIEYKGIIDGFEDLGRDIIAIKNGEARIIQCKRWAQRKKIHEKHVFQLFGTTMEYWIKNFRSHHQPKNFTEFSKFLNKNKIRPIFFTSTKLSEKAKEMATALSVEVIENEPLGEFPRIKCNINTDESGKKTKIYHLPMDQQYDRTIIGDRAGEFFAFTVKEAEGAGFRRAFKHRF